ncbi:transposase, IS605 OrfB, partial [mine drainage metagenome]
DGRRSELHFHRFDGTGTWTAQLQRENGDPVRSWEALVDGKSKWRNVVRITQEDLPDDSRREHPRILVSIRVGKDGDEVAYLTVPITMHRPIPPEGDITQIQVTRKRVGTHFRLSMAFTVRLPAKNTSERPGMVALDLGWRSMPDGSLRVATWIGMAPSGPLALPEWLAPWVRINADGTSGE